MCVCSWKILVHYFTKAVIGDSNEDQPEAKPSKSGSFCEHYHCPWGQYISEQQSHLSRFLVILLDISAGEKFQSR